MKTKDKNHRGVYLLLLTISGLLLMILVSSIISGCVSGTDTEPVPLFTWNIPIPNNDKGFAELTIKQGATITVPVNMWSPQGETVEVQLSVDWKEGFPQDFTITVPDEPVHIPVGQNVTYNVVYSAGENTAPGEYYTHIIAISKQPINSNAGLAKEIHIVVTE